MKCHQLREAIVELSRGGSAGPGTLAAVESHLEHCAACAALRTREQQLSAGLRALAAASSAQGAPDALERRMVEMFAAQQQPSVRAFAVHRAFAPRWLATAAAGVVVAGVAALWWWDSRSEVAVAGPTVTVHAPAPPEPVVPNRATGSVPPSLSPSPSPVANAVSRQPSRPKPAAASPVRAEFVALPGAVGLPPFESGEIVRLSIPVTSLPTYGIEILPDVKASPVRADLLIGQDGQARAIRLVTP
jgi:hypothetical protein